MSSACLVPGVAAIAGPPLVGYMLNCGLFGVLTTQVYLYQLAFSDDKLLIKFLVYSIYTLETAQTALLISNAFRIFGSGFADPRALNNIGTIWISIGILGPITACAVQTFYAYRISIISGKKTVSRAVCFFAWLAMASAFTCAGLMHQKTYFTEVQTTAIWSVTGIWEGSTVVCDVMIAVSVTYYLRKRAHSTNLAQTEVLVEKIIRLSIGTGSLTAIISIIGLGLTFLPSHADYYQAPIPALAKLYATTLMVHLNSRMKCSSTAESQAWTDSNKARTPTVIDCGGIQCRVSSMQFRDTDMVAAKRRSLMPAFFTMDEGSREKGVSKTGPTSAGKTGNHAHAPDVQHVSSVDSPTIV